MPPKSGKAKRKKREAAQKLASEAKAAAESSGATPQTPQKTAQVDPVGAQATRVQEEARAQAAREEEARAQAARQQEAKAQAAREEEAGAQASREGEEARVQAALEVAAALPAGCAASEPPPEPQPGAGSEEPPSGAMAEQAGPRWCDVSEGEQAAMLLLGWNRTLFEAQVGGRAWRLVFHLLPCIPSGRTPACAQECACSCCRLPPYLNIMFGNAYR